MIPRTPFKGIKKWFHDFGENPILPVLSGATCHMPEEKQFENCELSLRNFNTSRIKIMYMYMVHMFYNHLNMLIAREQFGTVKV